jgi:DNA-binding NtrC family response regulator
MPSLRDRRSDILQLAEYFLQFYSGQHGLRSTGFTEDAILKLQRYSIPGNVRELEHVVERAVLKAIGRAITSDIIAVDDPITSEPSGAKELEKLLDLQYRESIQAWERLLIDRTLRQANGNKAGAARLLGIHRRLLYDKLGVDSS